MYKITVKEMKDGSYQVEKNVNHANTIEALTIIDSVISDIEYFSDLKFRKIIKLIKETRKNATTEVVKDDSINNTNE